MGRTSTYGIEQPDGSILYNIYRDTVFHDSILHEFQKSRSVEIIHEESYHATSIEDYYSQARFEEEDSVVRGLLRLDGVLMWHCLGDDGFFSYTQNFG
uniref:Uncharacterized protein n=1 Tax=viral metagenome TaxID=1070528 RepID=A0A6C0D733_9ZZZZ